MDQLNADFFIRQYKLQSHPEGGYFAETYRSPEFIPRTGLPQRFTGERAFSTAIYFLLVGKQFSSFHRIQADETWHFYHGSPLELTMISPEGIHTMVMIGDNPTQGHCFQYTVPAGYWFASRCTDEKGHSFVGCTVAPGFDFDDFELAKADQLAAQYPSHEAIIRSLCRN
jgi:predicted cupin superfamily sugar epimerase